MESEANKEKVGTWETSTMYDHRMVIQTLGGIP